MDIFLQQIINGLVLGSVYALVALGYTMVYGILQLINFTHGEVLMVGAMVSLTVVSLLQTFFPGMALWVMMLTALLTAIPACMALSAAIELTQVGGQVFNACPAGVVAEDVDERIAGTLLNQSIEVWTEGCAPRSTAVCGFG